MCQRIGGGNTPSGVSPHPQGARLALRLVRQGDDILYPVGQPLFGDSLPFLLTSVADKELLRASEAPGAVHVHVQCSRWAAIAATYTFKVEGDSLRSNLSCRKESTTPIVHLWGSSRQEEHQFTNRLHFSA